jgi:hypothetical protein
MGTIEGLGSGRNEQPEAELRCGFKIEMVETALKHI